MSRNDHEYEHDLERTFAAPPPAHGRGFTQTWWGRAWLGALEDAALDGAAVKAGRRLARAGAVGAVTVRPGRVTAVVRDPKGVAHRADVLVPELSEEEWVRFLDLAVEQAGHLAALLDGELPSHLIEDAAVRGIDLLPGLGDLEPECDCGTWDHCGHTAALCHQVARLLDEDPFVLLLMHGRAKGAFLEELYLRSTAPSDEPAETEGEGVDAAEAWAAADILPPLPALPGVPKTPGEPPSFDTEVPPAPGIDPAALEHLASRTAAEAHRLLGHTLGAGGPGDGVFIELTAAQDAVRLADGAAPDAVTDRLAEGSQRGREGLATAVGAWRLGGAAALAVLDGEWQVTGAALARARAALEAAWETAERPSFQPVGNRWTVPEERVQLRLGRDGRWWPYREENGRWVPTGGPDPDPATALAAARLGPDSDPDTGI
ncbi:putative Zn finger protein [Streptomyces griseochromogenes]|uniref:SWF or SNF family helicase n=1 Tax=Streptomyces griseochromogenes TaxID=68214 RepID=A0A1B1B3I2_9ACTN|nr:SWF or SNF family helicase [Streptomyces griseochromogenes]ANP53370.1 SWF or SNF family helicase [Streptomyces griseochromogenes]MBP2055061.1 putative Zn finger protein [Streptomyces griseochromogenes]